MAAKTITWEQLTREADQSRPLWLLDHRLRGWRNVAYNPKTRAFFDRSRPNRKPITEGTDPSAFGVLLQRLETGQPLKAW